MIDQEARGRIAELEAQIGQLRGLAGGLQGVLRQLTDGRITTLHQHPFTPDVNYDEYCGDWELNDPDAALGLPDPPVTSAATSSDGNLWYFVDEISGKVFRTRNARAAAADVVYEDLGVVDTAGLVYITLDSFDPKNKAMVCGDGGVWRTINLDADIPSWEKVLDDVPGADPTRYHRFKMIASSILQEDLWMVSSSYWNPDQNDWFPFVHHSNDGGGSWTRYTGIHNSWNITCGGARRPTIEISAHTANKAWYTWTEGGEYEKVAITTDCWTSHANTAIPEIHDSQRPCSYHRYLDNATDQIALWGGKSGTGSLEGNMVHCTGDAGTCTSTKLSSGVAGDVHWCGGYTWGDDKYWALNKIAGAYEFHVSSDGITWTKQSTLPATSRFVSGWPYNGARFYACQDGTTAPLLISNDEGATWQEQTGNWATVGSNADIYCGVPVFAE